MSTATAEATKGKAPVKLGGLADLASAVRKTMAKANPDIVFDPKRKIDFMSSGDLVFDLVTGGGFPRRRLSEVFGQEHSGKSSICYSALGANQRAGGIGILIDAETAWDPVYAKNVYGLVEDGETFIVFQPETYEEVDGLLEMIMKLPKLDMLVYDSVDAIKPKALIERTADETVIPGMHAKAITHLVTKSKRFAKQANAALIFINQMRVNMIAAKFEQNVGTGAGFNPNETFTVTGGAALRYYGSLRVKLEYGGQLQDETGENLITKEAEKQRIGNFVKIINVKNKCATPFLKGMAQFRFPMPGQKGGWSEEDEVLDLLKRRGRIRQISTKFQYNGLNIAEWTNMGSKNASEAKFKGDIALVADAKALLLSLMSNAEETTQVLELATSADFTAEEVGTAEEQAGGGDDEISLSSIAGAAAGASDDVGDATPVSDVTL